MGEGTWIGMIWNSKEKFGYCTAGFTKKVVAEFAYKVQYHRKVSGSIYYCIVDLVGAAPAPTESTLQ